jgi:hypothetical protein
MASRTDVGSKLDGRPKLETVSLPTVSTTLTPKRHRVHAGGAYYLDFTLPSGTDHAGQIISVEVNATGPGAEHVRTHLTRSGPGQSDCLATMERSWSDLPQPGIVLFPSCSSASLVVSHTDPTAEQTIPFGGLFSTGWANIEVTITTHVPGAGETVYENNGSVDLHRLETGPDLDRALTAHDQVSLDFLVQEEFGNRTFTSVCLQSMLSLHTTALTINGTEYPATGSRDAASADGRVLWLWSNPQHRSDVTCFTLPPDVIVQGTNTVTLDTNSTNNVVASAYLTSHEAYGPGPDEPPGGGGGPIAE